MNANVATPDHEEIDFIIRAQNGDRHAFGELVQRHRKGVVNVVYRICGDSELAQDVAQDTFIKAWEKLAAYQPRSPFRNWLYRIASNTTMDSLRRQKQTVDIDQVPIASSNPGLEEKLENQERAKMVKKAVLALPEASRNVLVLREYENLSYKEISDILGIPLGTVMSRLNYARKKLFEMLEPTLQRGRQS